MKNQDSTAARRRLPARALAGLLVIAAGVAAFAPPASADETDYWWTGGGGTGVRANGSGRLHGDGENRRYETCTVEAQVWDGEADGHHAGVKITRDKIGQTSGRYTHWYRRNYNGNGSNQWFTLDIGVDYTVGSNGTDVEVREFVGEGSAILSIGPPEDACRNSLP
jgi:hypothetical protein